MPDGSVFVISDFSDLADQKTVSKTLTRLCKSGLAGKVMRGVFWKAGKITEDDIKLDFDEEDENIEVDVIDEPAEFIEGEGPDPDKVARALARSYLWKLVPSGDTAKHLIGIDSNAPAIWTYITDGAYRVYKYGNTIISFQHASSKFISSMSEKTALLVQVMKCYGKDAMPAGVLEKIKSFYKNSDKAAIISESKNTTSWIASSIRRLFRADLKQKSVAQ